MSRGIISNSNLSKKWCFYLSSLFYQRLINAFLSFFFCFLSFTFTSFTFRVPLLLDYHQYDYQLLQDESQDFLFFPFLLISLILEDVVVVCLKWVWFIIPSLFTDNSGIYLVWSSWTNWFICNSSFWHEKS